MSVNIFKNGILSKIAGAVGDAVPLINNFLTNQEGKGAADANTVYVLNNKIEELNSSLTADNSQKFQFAYDSESGKYGYKAKVEGADTFFPFSSGSIENGVINLSTSSESIITIGFEPDMVILINKYANSTMSPLIQISNKNNHLIWGSNMDKWNTSQNIFSVSFTNKGFSCKAFSSYSAYETYWYAIKI